MKKRMWIWGGLAAVAILAVGLFFFPRQDEAARQSRLGLFSWDDEAVSAAERQTFLSVLERMEIDTVYQALSEEQMQTEDTKSFLSDLHKQEIAVYSMAGAAEWGLESDGASARGEIKKVAAFNHSSPRSERFAGVLLDVEPYLSAEWKKASDEEKEVLFARYVDGMVAAYQTAQEQNISLLLCIPWFYEKYSETQLERLIAGGCDGIAVMNYQRSDEYAQMQTEVELARKYGKQIVDIAELQAPGNHDLEEMNTYYNAGLDALAESWRDLKERFQYQRLSFAYHYYAPLKEMLGKEQTA